MYCFTLTAHCHIPLVVVDTVHYSEGEEVANERRRERHRGDLAEALRSPEIPRHLPEGYGLEASTLLNRVETRL